MAPKGEGEGSDRPFSPNYNESLTTVSGSVNQGLATRRRPLPSIQVRENSQEIVEVGVQNWTDRELTESPTTKQHDSQPVQTTNSGLERRVKSRKPTPLNIGRPGTPESLLVASPSRARWEHLRQHVLPIPIRPATPPAIQPHGSHTSLAPPPRTPTPKPSRLARLGFRHVVEQAREVAVDDTRKFAYALQKVCWSTRFVEPHRVKPDREPPSMGPSIHLPFMSNASLVNTVTSSVDSLTHGSSKKHELRRPQSVQSMAPTYRSRPSLKTLYQALLHYGTPSVDGVFPLPNLPSEVLVLSTLLRPFMTSERGPHIEDERSIAIESFNIITRTWAPMDQAAGVERYLWCCRASGIPPSAHRTRLISTLWELMIPTETNYLTTTPNTFRTLAQGLFSLLPSMHPPSTSKDDQEDPGLLNDMISKLHYGCCGDFDAQAIQEIYNVTFSMEDEATVVRGAVLLEALSRCLEECTDDARLWLLQNSLETYWITYPKGRRFTKLLAAIHVRTLNNLGRALLNILSIAVDQPLYLLRAQCIARILQSRIIPEIEAIEAIGDTVIPESRMNVIKMVIELICMDKAKEPTRWGISLICRWYGESSTWKPSIEKAIEDHISNRDWPNILGKLSPLVKLLPDEVRKPLVAFMLPLLQDKLVEGPPPYPCLPLTNFFDTIARLYPRIFYKALFSCAASSKEFRVVNYLCIIVIVSKFLPDFWIRDVEMVSFALMSDAGMEKGTAPGKGSGARLGQSILLLEIIAYIQAVRHEKETTSNPEGGPSHVEVIKFAMALESRLGALLDEKERTSLIPPSQRLLLCVLFREIRLLTRSLKTASWLPRIVSWFIDQQVDDGTGEDPEVEEKSSVGQLQGLYAAAQDGIRSSGQRRSTVLWSKNLEKSHHVDDPSVSNSTDLATALSGRATLITSLSKGFMTRVMKLFVTISALLISADYRRLGPYLWEQVVSDGDASFTTCVCFLIMQCAEKTPLDLLAIIEVDLQSSDDSTKLRAIQKMSILSNWRFQVLSQHVVTDRTHRPFKLARGPLPFVATDVGSSLYIREDDPNELKDSLPSELRKRLAEIGWDQDDKPVDQQLEWIKTPMSLLPTYQFDHLDNTAPDLQPPSPSPNPHLTGAKVEEVGLLRRNSSTGGPLYGVKRRAVFVPSLTPIFLRLASSVFDANFAVASAAKEIIVDLMRNDPALLTRPVLDLFTGDQKDIRSAISTVNALLHVQRVLPSPMTHYMFNHLAGFLKFASRNAEGDNLYDFSHVVTILSKLVTQVSGMSIREIRRAKLDTFLIPSGSLWFPPSAPAGPMFPRGLGSSSPFDPLPSDLASITMIRVAQNLLFLSMLKRNRQDVSLIRKTMSRLVLPSMENKPNDTLGLLDFIPQRLPRNYDNPNIKALSLMLSRSHLLLVAQIFRSMSRHLNDRNELAILIDGLNQIMLAHGDDIGIVGQIMIALMVASTRFRRLFTSGGGYTLFMPAIIKVYTESESHIGIKFAIEYAVNRFYALHREAFVFQTLDIIAHITMLPNIEADWLAKSIYGLFSALRRGIPLSTPDAAGIHNSNKPEEREALIVSTAEEKPQTFLSLLRRGDPQNGDRITIDLPDEYETSRLGMDDFVRLFLTVIAHDPSIIRAEQFLRLLRYLTPYLYHASSSSRTVLQEGIDALGIVLIRAYSKPKSNDPPTQPTYEGSGVSFTEDLLENQLFEKSRSASDIMAMRLDYLSLVIAFTRAGGQLPQPATLRIMGLMGIILKDSPHDVSNNVSVLFTDFVRASLIREVPPSSKTVVALLQDLSSVISAFATTIDLTGIFESVAILAGNPLYTHDSAFSRVVTQICGSGLAACELPSSEKMIFSLPYRASLVALLNQAVLLQGADVISEIQKCTPSHDLLAGVVLPLVISLKTGSDLISDSMRTESWHRDVLASAWLRLLSYSMSACQRVAGSLNTSKGQDKGRLMGAKQLEYPTFVIALQILKTIIIRAEADLSSYLPSIWARIASFLTIVLAEGNSTFSTRPQDISPLHSPAPSPRASGQFDQLRPSISISTDIRSPSLRSQTVSSPRIIDYSLWSILELLCVYRNPLFLQLRMFMVEKLIDLDQDLQQQGTHTPVTSRSRPVSTSIYSKPRRRSGFPSPNSSPYLSPSQSFSPDPSFPYLEGRQAGYNNAASPQNSHGPRIIHLGPISATSMFGRGLSPGRGKGINNIVTTTKIKSLILVRSTYQRIRTVQSIMGYETLLPMPNNHEMDVDEVFATALTKKQVIAAIIQETKDLIEEFEESDRSLEDEGVMVDSQDYRASF